MNLVKFDLEKVDLLPSRQKFCDYNKSGLGRGIRRVYHYWDNKYTDKYQYHLRKVIGKVIESCVNLHYDIILPKVISKMSELRARGYSAEKLISWNVEIVGIDEDGDLCLRSPRLHNLKLKDYYNKSYVPSLRTFYFDENNVLRLFNPEAKPRPKVRWQDHYAKVTARKRRAKQWRKMRNEAGLHLLPHLNKTGLLSYYKKLIEKKQEYDRKIESGKEYENAQKGTWQYKWAWIYISSAKEAKEKVSRINEILERFDQYDVSDYYESKEYIYAQPKECHHYETP